MFSGLSLLILLSLLSLVWFVGLNYGRRGAAMRLLAIEEGISKEAAAREAAVIKREKLILSELEAVRQDGVLLPSLIRWADKLQHEADELDAKALLQKSRPAPAAAERLREANQKARLNKRLSDRLRNQIDLYESLAPWLREFTELSVDEVLTGLSDALSPETEADEDPAQRYLSRSEWKSLSEEERLQKALDNYMSPSRRKTLWQVGVDFERFVGYQYEKEGFKVEFHGATSGREDLGIDLICTKRNEVAIVQCKRLAAVKEIPVRENVVAQIYGAAEFYRLKKRLSKGVIVKPVLVTSYILSDQAREFADHLKVEVLEKLQLTSYPIIKCNVNSTTGEKIFHLPFDQQYDKIVVGDTAGECYANTVKEAMAMGFRHAYRWRGSQTK